MGQESRPRNGRGRASTAPGRVGPEGAGRGDVGPSAAPEEPDTGSGLRDGQLVARIWPLLVAAALGLVPFTVFSTFLVDITAVAGGDPALTGSLRGLGGVAALAVGVLCAPLLDRLSRPATAAASLVLLAAACLLAVRGSTGSWVVFCLLVGAGTSTLNPAVGAMAADRFRDEAASGRAATLVSSVMTLTAMLAAPLLALPALWWGWRGDLAATAAACVLVAVLMLRLPGRGLGAAVPHEAGPGQGRPGYLGSLRTAFGIPGAAALLGVSALRTSAFMGQLAYIAVYYDERFGVPSGAFALVWTLSGLAFFLGNWFGGKFLRRLTGSRTTAWTMAAACCGGTLSVAGLFLARNLLFALAMTALLAVCHAVVAASVTTLLVRRSAERRGTVLSLNGAGQSLGVFLGAGIAGLALAAGSWTGVGLGLAGVTAAGLGLSLHFLRTVRQ